MYDFHNIEDPRRFNETFVARLDEEGGVKRAEAATRNFVQIRMRERGFSRNLMPPEVLQADDCQPSADHDLLTKIVDRAFDNTDAMAANFMGTHDGRYIKGDRKVAKFQKLETLEYRIHEGKILSFPYPVIEWIEKISVKDLEKAEDLKWKELSDVAVAATGKLINSPATQIDKQVATTLIKMLDGDELEFDTFLMHKVDFDDWCSLPATIVGDTLAKETSTDGWNYQTIQGRKLVTTIKNIIPYGHIYGYTKPEMLGVFYLLGDTRFAIRKKYDKIYMKSWEYIAMLFCNNRAVAKVVMNVPHPLTG